MFTPLQANSQCHERHDRGAHLHIYDNFNRISKSPTHAHLWPGPEINFPAPLYLAMQVLSHVQQRHALLATCLKCPCLR